MYNVKPLHDVNGAIQPCNVMYKMPRLQGNIDMSTHEESSEVISLKHRQDKLLCFLDQLIGEVSSCQISPVISTFDNKNKTVLDIVLQANPRKPPRSLKFICQLLKKKYRVLFKTHMHSSVRGDVDTSLLNLNETCTDRSQYDIVITLILTEVVDYPIATVNPANVTSISGESNIARLFGRLLGVYDTGSATLPFTCQTDAFLDACDVIVSSAASQADKQSAIRMFEDVLKRDSWLCGSQRSLADAVAFSALIQSNSSLKSPAGQGWMKAQII